MARTQKVYGWRGFRGHQTREIMAATSAAEVMRRTGLSRATWEWSGGETRNPEEVQQASTKPGTVFWHPLDEHFHDREWREDPITD